MNAELVSRLESTFAASINASLPPLQMSVGDRSPDVEKLLRTLPEDLASQYGLHLYRTEQKVVEAQLEEAREEYDPLYDKLQRALAKEGGPPGPKARAKEAVAVADRRIGELENQLRALDSTIGAIHLYRKSHGLPGIRNVREVSVAVRIGGTSDATPARSA